MTFLVSACGRKAPPRPPEDVRPKTIADLTASNVADGVQLSWSRPRAYADGSPMTDLGGFVVERADGADPHAAFQHVAQLEVTDRDRFRQIKSFRYLDRDTSVGTPYRYRVVSYTLDRYFSAPSNIASLERATVAEEKHAPLSATPR
ncbi:MAG: hypothetical protein ACHQ4J_11130 [Candidatus Binatia bacterium]